MVRTIGLLALSVLAAALVAACSSSTETIVETVVVEKEVIKEVQVAGEVVEVVVEKEVLVKGDTKIETVIEKVVETVKGDKEVVLQTVVVEKVVEVEAEVAPTFYGLPLPAVPETVDPAPAPQSPDGTVVVRGGLELRGSGMPGDSSGGMFTGQSVTEKLFLTNAAGDAVNQVVADWTLAEDLSKLTVVLKPDIPFHAGPGGEDFGVLTAADVAWSINTGNPGYNPVSATDGGANWIAFIGDKEVLAIDTYTVEIPIDNFDIRWPTFILGQSGLALSITSKNAYDTMGDTPEESESWVRDHVIGTGPFKVENYSRDDVLELSRVEDHHRQTPEVETYILRAIPDDDTAKAALQTGAVDISDVALDEMTSLQKAGFEVLSAGAGSFHSISFSGNYWERTHYCAAGKSVAEGGDCDPYDLGDNFTVKHHMPWVGDPERDDFGSPPAGMTNMERAQKVRTALSWAIDRELISEVLFANAAWPNYVYGADINNPNWQDKWATPYDVAAAEALLDEAGYEKDDDGIRFEMPFFIRIGRGDEDIGVAVSGMWGEIGIDVQYWKAQYQTYRPNLIGRTAIAPWIHSAGAEAPHNPWDWAVMGSSECSRGRGGFNIGIEILELCKFMDDMNAESDKAARIELRNANVEFLAENMPVIGTVARPNVALANPNKIASWDMPLAVREAALHHPEFIKLK
jgi:ABC-type transport system substrate-binding protein